MIQSLQVSLLSTWRNSTWTQRVSLFGLSVAVLGTIAFVAMWANTPAYGVLFSGLSNQDAGTILNQLNASKISYQLDNGGSTILVPQSMVDQERLQLASQNLPSGDVVGFETFGKTNIFQGDPMTEQVNYTRALEGELTRTISQVAGVSYARVNIVVPQQQLFSSQQDSPTASVLVKMLPGSSLTSDQIGGIQHLVSSGVQGLKPADVTVVDGSGSILSGNSMLGAAGVSGLTVLAAESRYASNLQAQLIAMLDTVLGPDKAIVRVNDTMDFTQTDETVNAYNPQNSASTIGESHTVTNTSAGPSSIVGGPVGIASNVPTYGTSIKTSGGVTQTQQSQDVTYLQGSTIAHITRAPGAVNRLSIAVLLDSASITNTALLPRLHDAVFAAAGMQVGRGDQLTISSVPFDNSAQKAAVVAAASATQQAFIINIVRWAALIIVPLVLLFLLRRLVGGSSEEEYDDLPTVEEVDPETSMLVQPVGRLTIQEQQRSQLQKSMGDLAREKPESVAGVIGRWIEEDNG